MKYTVSSASTIVPDAGSDPPSGAVPAPAPSPRRPSFEMIVSGRGLAASGALLVLIGAAYFLQLEIARGVLRPEIRIALGLLLGAALLAGATRLMRGAYRALAEGIASLGAGLVYLSSWAGITHYAAHISRGFAFACMVGATLALVASASRFRSQPIALMGLLGAYLTPLLLDGMGDRTSLAAYLLITTTALLGLARACNFRAVEITAAVAPLLFAFGFAPDGELWTRVNATIVASLFFIVYGTLFSLPPRATTATFTRCALPFGLSVSTFAAIIALLYQEDHSASGLLFLGIAALLLLVRRALRLQAPLRGAYHAASASLFTLAAAALLGGTQLLDVLSLEASVLVIYGARTVNVIATRLGIVALAATGSDLIVRAVTDAPSSMLLSPLAISFAIWIAVTYVIRDSVPREFKITAMLVSHVVAFTAITRVALDATGGPHWNAEFPAGAQMAISLGWTIFAATLFASGVNGGSRLRRSEGLCIFALTMVKIFSIDLAALDMSARVVALIGTGTVLLGCSAWYGRANRGSADLEIAS